MSQMDDHIFNCNEACKQQNDILQSNNGTQLSKV